MRGAVVKILLALLALVNLTLLGCLACEPAIRRAYGERLGVRVR